MPQELKNSLVTYPLNSQQTNAIELKHEFVRKAIHVLFPSSLVLVLYLPYHVVALSLGGILVCMLLFEYIRLGHSFISMRVRGILRQSGMASILRSHEAQRYTGATFLVLSACICLVLLSPRIYVLSYLVLGWADTAAALVGRAVGRHPLPNGKTLEGSIAFFAVAMMVVSICGGIWGYNEAFLVMGSLAAAVATFVELGAHRYGIDDNLAVPLAFGLVCEGLIYLL